MKGMLLTCSVVHEDPKSFYVKLLSALSLYCCMKLFLPGCRTIHLSSFNFMRFSPVCWNNFQKAIPLSNIFITHHNVVALINLLRVHSILSLLVFMKTFSLKWTCMLRYIFIPISEEFNPSRWCVGKGLNEMNIQVLLLLHNQNMHVEI